MQVINGKLVILDANTRNITVLWNGITVPYVSEVKLDWEPDESKVVIKVTQLDPIHGDMSLDGIRIKLAGRK